MPDKSHGAAVVRQLLADGQWEAAQAEAKRQLDSSEPASDRAAQWAVTLSKVRGELLLRSSASDEEGLLAAAIEPVAQILTAYPDHRYAAWLRFQLLAIDAAVWRRRSLAIQAVPGDEAMRLSVLAGLIDTARKLSDLRAEVVDSIAQAFARGEAPQWIDRSMSLRNAITVERVALLLARGELFAVGSVDYLAAAEEADRAAIEAIEMIRDAPQVQADLARMRCEALLRIGQPDQASQLLVPLLANSRLTTSEDRDTLDDATRALAVRVALERGNWGEAKQWLDAHYRRQPETAPRSPETDLARLRYLIANQAQEKKPAQPRVPSEISGWIAKIRDRGGDWLHRRAQILVVEMLGDESSPYLSDDWMFHEVAVLLKQGRTEPAVARLAEQARNGENHDTAIKAAKIAAAVLVNAGDFQRAADTLAHTAGRFSESEDAAAMMLESARLLDKSGDADRVDQQLRDLMLRWPTDRHAALARQWLIQRIENHATASTVASLATPEPIVDRRVLKELQRIDDRDRHDFILQIYQDTWRQAESLWIKAFTEVEPLDAAMQVSPTHIELRQRAEAALGDSGSLPALRCRKTLATLFQSSSVLSKPEFRPLPIDNQPLIDWLYAVRTSGQVTPAPESPDPALRLAAALALVVDGYERPALRRQLSPAIVDLVADVPATEWVRAQAILWSGDVQRAGEILDGWIAKGPANDQAEIAALRAASMFRLSGDANAIRQALDRYLALSKTCSPRSPHWHDVKLGTIEALAATGNTTEAKQLARYTLITRPPSEEATRLRYEVLAR